MPTESSVLAVARKLALLAAPLAASIGMLALANLAVDIPLLKSISPDWVSMNANTALGFVLIGIVMMLSTPPPDTPDFKFSTLFSRIALVSGLLIGLLTQAEYIFSWNLGIDQWLFLEPTGAASTSHPGRMSPETALCFVLLSAALWINNVSYKNHDGIASVSIGMLVLTLALTAMLTHFTPSLGDFGWFGYTIMAVPTAVLFALLSLSIVITNWPQFVLSWTLNKKDTLAIVFGMFLLVIIGLDTSRTQSWLMDTNRKIEVAEQLLDDIENVQNGVIDAQSDANIFLLTGHEQLMQHYLADEAEINAKLNALRKIGSNSADPLQQQFFARIEAPAKAQLDWHHRVFDDVRTGLTDTARIKIMSHGEQLLNNLRSAFGQITTEHRQRVEELKQHSESVREYTYIMIFSGTLASLAIFLTALFRINQAGNRRNEDEAILNLQARRAEALLKLPRAAEHLVEKSFMQYGQELVENLTGSQIAFIHFVNNDHETIELVNWSKNTIERYCHANHDSHYPVSKAGIWADAVRNGKPVVLNDYASYPFKRELPEGHSELKRLISLPVLENGKVVMITGVGNKATDYTEMDVETVQLLSNEIWQILQQQRMARKVARFSHMLEQSLNEIYIFDSRTLRYIEVNLGARVNLGYSHAELEQLTPLDIRPGLTKASFEDRVAPLRSRKAKRLRFETEHRRKDGSCYPVEVHLELTEDDPQLFIAVIQDISERKLAGDALLAREKELGELYAELQTVREEERKSLARELHDELGQVVTALRIDLNWLEARLPKTEPHMAGKMLAMNGLIDRTVGTIRRISEAMRPGMLDQLGLTAALENHVAKFQDQTGIACDLTFSREDFNVCDKTSINLFRIVQEALTNAARYSGASLITIELQENIDEIMLTVQDNGCGLPAGPTKGRKTFGLLGMRERVAIMGGRISIFSQPNAGVGIEVAIPKHRNQEEQ